MSNFEISIITAIWNTPTDYFVETLSNMNKLLQYEIPIKWSIVIDGDSRKLESLIDNHTESSVKKYITINRLKEKKGLSAARNIGVKECESDYICWLDADDAIDHENFQKVLNILRSRREFLEHYDLIFTDSYDCDKNLSVKSIRKKELLYSLHYKLKNTVDDPLLGVDFIYQMQLIKRDAFLSIGGFNEKLSIGEDVDLLLRLSEASKKVNFHHLPIPVYYYRDNPTGICNSRWDELKKSMESIYTSSSKRQGYLFNEFRYHGTFSLSNNMLVQKTNDGVSLYDVYLPLDSGNQIQKRDYIWN